MKRPATRRRAPKALHSLAAGASAADVLPEGFPPLAVRAGILVVDGYGISLRVLYGKLHIGDGIADRRRAIILDRAGRAQSATVPEAKRSGDAPAANGGRLDRLVLLGKTGSLTLDALAWLRSIGAALVHVSPDGALLGHTVPYGYSGLPVRRAQALAVTTGHAVSLARDLIKHKLDGQRDVLKHLGSGDRRMFETVAGGLERAKSIDELRLVEARAASLYWAVWASVPIRWKKGDLARIPASWARYDSRASILTGSPRAASNPINALLNYLYTVLEAEARLALLAAGLDPTLGILHADQRGRDSFALDVLEPVRPDVDRFVLGLLEKRVFGARDFVEMPNGICRLRAPLTHELALTMPRWRLLCEPVVARLAEAFRAALRTPEDGDQDAREPAAVLHTSAQSPLADTPRAAPASRPYATGAWKGPRLEPLAMLPVACASCGKLVEKRRRRYCDACLPGVRRARAEQAVESARKSLALEAHTEGDPRTSARANARRSVAIATQHRDNREWARGPGGAEKEASDREWFLREITPKLDRFSLGMIGTATGLSPSACSKVRAGKRVPHPRHWPAFVSLVERPDDP